jgi:hypothetical protein
VDPETDLWQRSQSHEEWRHLEKQFLAARRQDDYPWKTTIRGGCACSRATTTTEIDFALTSPSKYSDGIADCASGYVVFNGKVCMGLASLHGDGVQGYPFLVS